MYLSVKNGFIASSYPKFSNDFQDVRKDREVCANVLPSEMGRGQWQYVLIEKVGGLRLFLGFDK